MNLLLLTWLPPIPLPPYLNCLFSLPETEKKVIIISQPSISILYSLRSVYSCIPSIWLPFFPFPFKSFLPRCLMTFWTEIIHRAEEPWADRKSGTWGNRRYIAQHREKRILCVSHFWDFGAVWCFLLMYVRGRGLGNNYWVLIALPR